MLALGLRKDGEYAADTTVFSIPRQVGKTYLIGCVIFALCLMKPGLRVIWTAQVKDTALETYAKFVELVDASPRLRRHIGRMPSGKGDEAIVFVNGSSIEFGARESGFGRGRTDVDVIVFDEGQHLSTNALENLGAAQNVAVNPLCFVMGTPPRPQDKGEWFSLLRQEALDGESDGTLYIEFSADRGAEPMDRDQWRKANPSFPLRTSERAMLRLRKKLKNPDSWNREALGIWDKVDVQQRVVTPSLWNRLVEDEPPEQDVPPSALAVDMSHSRVVAIGGCWLKHDRPYVELLELDAVSDTTGAVQYLAERAGRRIPVVIDADSPAVSMVPDLKALKVKVVVATVPEVGKACGGWMDDVLEHRLSHAGQSQVDDVLALVRKRSIGKAGRWVWDRSDPSKNIAPLAALTLARYGAVTAGKTEELPALMFTM